jgi:transcriptional regulator with XRE-family HTH domain
MKKQPECIRYPYNIVIMGKSGGEWIRTRRLELRLRQADVAERAGVSVSYISTLEREQPHSMTGAELRPEPEKVKAIAKALQSDPNALLSLYGYKTTPHPPQTLAELLTRLDELGIDGGIRFLDQDAYRNATPEELQSVLEAVEVAVGVALKRINAPRHPHSDLHDTR